MTPICHSEPKAKSLAERKQIPENVP